MSLPLEISPFFPYYYLPLHLENKLFSAVSLQLSQDEGAVSTSFPHLQAGLGCCRASLILETWLCAEMRVLLVQQRTRSFSDCLVLHPTSTPTPPRGILLPVSCPEQRGGTSFLAGSRSWAETALDGGDDPGTMHLQPGRSGPRALSGFRSC